MFLLAESLQRCKPGDVECLRTVMTQIIQTQASGKNHVAFQIQFIAFQSHECCIAVLKNKQMPIVATCEGDKNHSTHLFNDNSILKKKNAIRDLHFEFI